MRLTTENLLIEPALSGGAIIRFETLDLKYMPDLMHKYEGRKMTVEVKEKKGNRSLDANAYCWVLCDKIAAVKGILVKKGDVYKQAIRDYGVSTLIPVETKRLEMILKAWDDQGYGNDHDIVGKSRYEGYTNVRLYVGSSKYNTSEMSKLIDGLVADAQDLGIETMTPAELENLKAIWGEK